MSLVATGLRKLADWRDHGRLAIVLEPALHWLADRLEGER